MGDGLKGLWGVKHPAPAASGEQATQFKASFEAQITAINDDLRYVAANAEGAIGQPLSARRDALYLAYQAASGRIDAAKPESAPESAEPVLADARTLSGETAAARAAAQKALEAWQQRQGAYDDAVHGVEGLEARDDPQAAALRSETEAIRGDVDARRYDGATRRFDALQPRLESIDAPVSAKGEAPSPGGQDPAPATATATATPTSTPSGANAPATDETGSAQKPAATAGATSATDEKGFVAALVAGGTRDENALTDQVFYRRHPELSGQRIVAGSEGAKEWVQIRNTIVRAALAAPPQASPASAATPKTDAAVGTQNDGVPAQAPSLLDSAVSAGSAIVGAIENAASETWDWLTGSDAKDADGGAAQPQQPQQQPPALVAEPAAPAQSAPAGEGGAAFESQLDNQFLGKAGEGATSKDKADVKPENECNVTSLSMQLQTIAGDKAKVRNAVCDLLEQQYGQSVSAEDRGDGTQIEDLLLRRFFLSDWASGKKWREASDAGAKPFYKGWYQEMEANPDVSQVREKKFHQMVYCMQYVAIELSKWIPVGRAVAGAGTSPQTFTDLKKVIDSGGSVQLGTKLTGGHVVLLVDVLADGIVINDPYGLALKAGSSNYILNGATRETAEAKLAAVDPSRALLSTRTKLRPDVAQALAEGATASLPPNPGERVFFTFKEAESWQIGKWNSQISKA